MREVARQLVERDIREPDEFDENNVDRGGKRGRVQEGVKRVGASYD